MQRFGDHVRKVRVNRHIRLAEIADALGFTAVHVSDIERGHRNPPSAHKVRDWARFLELDEDQLVSEAEVDVDTVKLSVNHDPKKAEVALAFARQLDGMSESRRTELLDFLMQDDPNE